MRTAVTSCCVVRPSLWPRPCRASAGNEPERYLCSPVRRRISNAASCLSVVSLVRWISLAGCVMRLLYTPRRYERMTEQHGRPQTFAGVVGWPHADPSPVSLLSQRSTADPPALLPTESPRSSSSISPASGPPQRVNLPPDLIDCSSSPDTPTRSSLAFGASPAASDQRRLGDG